MILADAVVLGYRSDFLKTFLAKLLIPLWLCDFDIHISAAKY
jgi:hypothetical protein